MDILATKNIKHFTLDNKYVYLNEEITQYTSDLNEKLLLEEFFEKHNFEEFDKYLHIVYQRIVKNLQKFLAEYTSIHEDIKYCETIFGYFVHKYIYAMYPKYLYIIAAQPLGRLISYKPQKKLYIKSANEFFDLLYDKDFHEHLYAQTIEYINCDKLSIQNDDAPPFLSQLNHNIALTENTNFQWSYTKYQNLAYLIYFGKLDTIKLNLAGCSLIKVPATSYESFYQGEFKYHLNNELRHMLGNIQGADEFESFIYKTLETNLPITLLEKLESYQEFSYQLANVWKPKKIITSQGLFYDQSFAFFVAESRKKNSQFFMSQHGGLCNEYIEPEETFEKNASDCLISWGWHGKNVIPLQSSKRISFTNYLKKWLLPKKYKILIVTTEEPKNIIRVMNAIFGYRMLSYIQFQASLIRLMCSYFKQSVHVRLYPRDSFGWSIKQSIEQADTGASFSNTKENILPQMARSQLVVFDYLGASSLIDAIRLNIPFLVVYNERVHKLHPDVVHWYQLLSQHQIVHNSIASCKEAMEDILRAGSIRKWWHEKDRAQIIEEFCCEFNINYRHLSLWKKFLKDKIVIKTTEKCEETQNENSTMH